MKIVQKDIIVHSNQEFRKSILVLQDLNAQLDLSISSTVYLAHISFYQIKELAQIAQLDSSAQKMIQTTQKFYQRQQFVPLDIIVLKEHRHLLLVQPANTVLNLAYHLNLNAKIVHQGITVQEVALHQQDNVKLDIIVLERQR